MKVVTLPGTCATSQRIYVFAKEPGKITWSRENPGARETLELAGMLADRVGNCLALERRDTSINCNGLGLYVVGALNEPGDIWGNREFGNIYSAFPVRFSYNQQPAPVLVHLLNERPNVEGASSLPDYQAIVHSLVLLGTLEGEDVCFENRFLQGNICSTVAASEHHTIEQGREIPSYRGGGYNTLHRLYVQPQQI
ncbi:MAG: hypothetical protein OXR66_01305 [Candidatus Woesearchaeota archaeon]|nr:hypothetical protein [Candidatus Woesearchaeota archaeon]